MQKAVAINRACYEARFYFDSPEVLGIRWTGENQQEFGGAAIGTRGMHFTRLGRVCYIALRQNRTPNLDMRPRFVEHNGLVLMGLLHRSDIASDPVVATCSETFPDGSRVLETYNVDAQAMRERHAMLERLTPQDFLPEPSA